MKVYIIKGEISNVDNSEEIFQVYKSKIRAKIKMNKYKKGATKFGYNWFWIEEWEVS